MRVTVKATHMVKYGGKFYSSGEKIPVEEQDAPKFPGAEWEQELPVRRGRPKKR